MLDAEEITTKDENHAKIHQNEAERHLKLKKKTKKEISC